MAFEDSHLLFLRGSKIGNASGQIMLYVHVLGTTCCQFESPEEINKYTKRFLLTSQPIILELIPPLYSHGSETNKLPRGQCPFTLNVVVGVFAITMATGCIGPLDSCLQNNVIYIKTKNDG